MAKNIVPSNQPSVFDPLNALSNLSTQQAIIRPTNPPPGIAGYLMNIVSDDDVTLRAGITDHYVEDNTAIQDQIALHPVIISLRGFVAELGLTNPTEQQLQPIPDSLATVPGMEPVGTPGSDQVEAQQAAAEAETAAQAEDTQSLFNYYQDNAGLRPNATEQERIFGYFYQLWLGRQIFTVETPFGFFDSMTILSVRMTQPEDTKDVSELAITFKQLRFAQELTVTVGQLAGRAEFQQADVTQNGVLGTKDQTPTQKESILFKLFGPSP